MKEKRTCKFGDSVLRDSVYYVTHLNDAPHFLDIERHRATSFHIFQGMLHYEGRQLVNILNKSPLEMEIDCEV